MRRVLTVSFDVTGLSEVQVDSLLLSLHAQAEGFEDDYPDSDGDLSYPEVPVLGHSVTEIIR